MLELSYFTWVFLVTRPFRGCQYFDPVTLTLEIGSLFEHIIFVNNFWIMSARPLIFQMIFFKWKDLSMGTNRFSLVTLTLEFGLLLENFNLANNLRTVSSRDLGLNLLTLTYDLLLKKIDTGHIYSIHVRNISAFKLHMIISCDKIFLLVSRYLSFCSWSYFGHYWGHICFTKTSRLVF